MKIRKIEAYELIEAKKIRVAAYCRVSTENDDQKESLEAQKTHYETWIKRHYDWEFAGVFYDLGISGTKSDTRDGLQALLYGCRTGRIDYVLTKSVSRFSRNTTDCLSFVRELLSYNIPIYFEKENLDTGSMESELILSILSSMAQGESESISKNVKWTVQQRIEAGIFKFGYSPYGYTRDEDGNLVIDPEEADVIRLIFSSALNGMEIYKIAQMLEKKKIPTRKGGRWSSSTVKGILINEKYYGAATFQKTYTDSNFKRQTQAVGIAWACRTHLYNKDACSMKFIKDAAIKAAFVTMLNKLIFGYKLILLPYLEALKLSDTDANLQQILDLKSELQKNVDKKHDLRKLRVNGFLDSVMYTQELRRIEKQNEGYRAALKNLDRTAVNGGVKETEKLLRFIESLEMQTEFSDGIFTDYAESITVYSRTCVGFCLKCGLTLKEELCTGTE